MGYYTYFEMGVENYGNEKPSDVAKVNADIVKSIMEMYHKKGEMFYPIAQTIEDNGGTDEYEDEDGDLSIQADEEAKWYDNDDDMRALALKFPDITFYLKGDGEERGDSWCSYYKGDKKCHYVATLPDFDPNDLE